MQARFISPIIVCALLSLSIPSHSIAQEGNNSEVQSTEIANWLDREIAGLLYVPDPEGTYDRLKQMPVFTSEQWDSVIGPLTDEEDPIFDEERAETIFTVLWEIDGLLSHLDELGIAVHDFPSMQYTIFLKAKPKHLDRLRDSIKTLIVCCFGETNRPIEELLEMDLAEANELGLQNGIGELIDFQGYLVLCNHAPYLEFMREINANGLEEKFKPLAEDRAYQTIVKRSERFHGHEGLISVFVRPAACNWFFPESDENEWQGYGYADLPGAGLNFMFMNPPEDSNSPYMIADASIMFTQPKSGTALLRDYYTPFEIPYLTVKPIELLGFARDEAKFNVESNRCYDSVYGKGAAQRWWNSRYESSGRVLEEDVFPRRKVYTELKYLEGDQVHVMRMEAIKDRAAMYRYVNGTVSDANNQNQHKLDSHHENDSYVWRLDEEAAAKNIGKKGAYTVRLHSDNLTLDSYLVGQDWYVMGEWPQSELQLAHLEGETELIDHGQPIREIIDDLLLRAEDSNPYEIRYFEPASWTEKIRRLGYQPRQFLSGGTFRVLQLEDGEGGFRIDLQPMKEGDEVPQEDGQLRLQFEGGPEGDTKRIVGLEQLDGQVLQLRLDANGAVVENDEELSRQHKSQTAIGKSKMAIGQIFADAFGRQIYLYCQNKNEIRVMLGCYPMPPKAEQIESSEK